VFFLRTISHPFVSFVKKIEEEISDGYPSPPLFVLEAFYEANGLETLFFSGYDPHFEGDEPTVSRVI